MSINAALPFYRRVDAALHDEALQTALGRATSRFVGNRASALATLTDAEGLRDQARAVRADMGISGVNFGVANEGAIVLVTNEGNGRLTTSVPPIHVAVMGIERIVESLDDLGVLLQLLGRSATGQKLTTYTSILGGPARK